MAWLQLATPVPLDWYQVASCTHASRKLSGLPHPTAIMWLSPLIFFPPHCSWLEHSSWSGPLPLTYSGVWFTDNPICMLLSWYSTELRPYHEEPRFSFSCFLLLSLVAPLLCFCCSLHSTPSITWPVYYRLGVFNILKSSRNYWKKKTHPGSIPGYGQSDYVAFVTPLVPVRHGGNGCHLCDVFFKTELVKAILWRSNGCNTTTTERR